MITLKLPGGRVWDVAVSADGARVAALGLGGVWAADRAVGYAEQRLDDYFVIGRDCRRGSLAVHPSGGFVAWALPNGGAGAFDFAAARLCESVGFDARGRPFLRAPQVRFSPDGAELWVVSTKRLRRAVGTWATLPPAGLPFPGGVVRLVAADGRAVVGWTDGPPGVRSYQFRSAGGACTDVVVQGPPDAPVCADPGGSVFAAGVEATGFTVWDTAAGGERFALPPRGTARVRALAFTPDGRTLLVGHGPRVRAFDTASWAERAALDWRAGPVTALAVSGDGLTAVAGTRTGRVVVWDFGG